MGIWELLLSTFSRIFRWIQLDINTKRIIAANKEPDLVINKENEWVLKNIGKGPAKKVFVCIGQKDNNYKKGKSTVFSSRRPIMIDVVSEKDDPIPLTLWLDKDRNVIRNIGRFGVTYENADGKHKKAFVKQGDETIIEKPGNVIFKKGPEPYRKRLKFLEAIDKRQR